MSDSLREQLQASLGAAYTIDRELGQGGMATVFLARDLKHHRPVALKVLDPELGASLGTERFLAEIRVTAHLQHPNVLPLFDSGETNGLLFYVMPFVAGESLRAKLDREGPLPIDEAVRIATAVASALDHAHRHGVVHRDVKPANVLLSDGVPMVADFGIAKAVSNSRRDDASATTGLTQSGLAIGTPSYMSPEQAMGEPVDGRSDVYALGCMLYEMLSGAVPFSGPSGQSIIAQHLTMPAPSIRAKRHAVPLNVDATIMRAMAKESGDRFTTPAQFAAALVGPSPARELIVGPRLTSLAVLPFVFLSGVDDSRALSLGFADALITIFGNLDDVVVAPTSAILNYAAATEPAQVCRELGVRHALQGTVQQLGSHWRVSIQLFDATTRKVTLSEKHDFVMDNVFEVQDEIGRRVVESLQSRFPQAVSKSRDRYSSNPDAYNAFMAGLRESSSDRHDALRVAAEHLSRAVERDPDFALAHATLSLVSMNIQLQFDSQRMWLQQAEDHCRKALELDTSLPEGHLARAWILWSPAKNFQHAEAIAALDLVLAARPNLERAHNRMSTICQHIGRLEEGRIAHEQALRANPKTRTGNLEYFYIYSGDFARAEEAADAWFRERPGNPYALATRVLTALMCGTLAIAGERLELAVQQLPGDPLLVTFEGMLCARRNQTDLALDCIRRALDTPQSFGHTHHTYYNIACIYAVLGEADKAIAWLERTADTGFPCWPFFRIDPHLEKVREMPRFTRLVADLEETYTTLDIQRL